MPNGEVLTYNSDGKVTAVSNPANGAAVSNISYTYDDNDNIKTISENGVQKVSYTYDSSNELTREDNVWQNETIAYTYDNNGNIESKTVYPYTTGDLSSVTATSTVPYTYGNTSDTSQLTNYNGKSITYDTNGNMTGYDGWTYTWSGKNLSGSSKTGSTVSYSYNSDGIRTGKTVNGTTTTYTLNNNVIKSQTDGTNTISYTYDDESNPLTMTLNGTKYTYEKNAQGDITGLIDSTNKEVVTYSYDSWGKLLNIGGTLASTVGAINPLRYRGYYYDTETGMYYLQSRYYNPVIGRFISKDDQNYHENETDIDANLYAYADNNPVMNIDPSGEWVQYLSGFKWVSTRTGPGFRVNVSTKFLSKNYCIRFAIDILSMRGNWSWRYGWNYNSLNLVELAAECFTHAVFYYFTSVTIRLFKRGYNWNNSGRVIDVAKGDPREWQFLAVWYGSYLFRRYGLYF